MLNSRLIVMWKLSHAIENKLRENIKDWRFLNVQSIGELSALARNIDCCVGLFCVEQAPNAAQLKELEAVFFNNFKIQWIGLISSKLVAYSPLQHLIANYAHDYHTLPADLPLLAKSLGHALGMAHLWRQLKSPPVVQVTMPDLIGISAALENIRHLVRKLAATNAPVLITGESGTGKEVVARALHDLSGRAKAPFVPVNSGAFPEGLIQSELFGHKKGAFTGALTDKEGRVESARGGTLFLDEIGDLPKSLQVYLLRFLQEGTIEKIGVQKSIHVDVRVVAATHVDLVKAVAQGFFREDLFYRLNVLRIHIPPLRERPEDIPLLAEHYLQRYNGDGGCLVRGFSSAAYEHLCRHSWPGNVRELVNCVRRAVLMSRNRIIGPAELELPLNTADPPPRSLSKVREAADKRAIESTLRFTGNNVSAASRMLNISRLSLYRLMEKYEVNLPREH